MKLVLTVLARDEVDVIDAQLAFHLNAGVDYVIATDNLRRTTESWGVEREGVVHLVREPAEGLRGRGSRAWRGSPPSNSVRTGDQQ
jgi:hypothetical protein